MMCRQSKEYFVKTTENQETGKKTRPYRAPQLLVYGDIRELTLAAATQNFGADNPMFPRLMT